MIEEKSYDILIVRFKEGYADVREEINGCFIGYRFLIIHNIRFEVVRNYLYETSPMTSRLFRIQPYN